VRDDAADDPAQRAREVAAGQDDATAGERRRLARELHDCVAPQLYGIGLGARVARALLTSDPAAADRALEQILHATATGLAETRRLIFQLRPEALAGGGLADALGRLLDTLHSLHGVSTGLHLDWQPDPESQPAVRPEVREGLYRIAQEAVQNAAQHARARRVTVRLSHRDSMLILEVADDGIGFQPHGDFPGRLGLRSMRERTTAAGGRLDIRSGPDGTVVSAYLPAEVSADPRPSESGE
jgi:signal transduction histidine kinase